ncbi:Wzz/FepE/Etk N-terminal domain-containing protein [Nonomuraea sp. 3-1Str]|uniref:Wzz/FepE/Etk N-terminal domain-containing protein n=1 Tax=Nonomuraea sp. 3-1Str TaxID=2929801 RepID=UPI002860F05F|nr:Wzz/FepE/Etk N-terminal domain-containing protein [Nonomuraea sp. 3-1Str]MDR8409937.1 Wzz/FepE/Etk N-terminal domain-containing protein [Nonomuraea sp. 3-1Str]
MSLPPDLPARRSGTDLGEHLSLLRRRRLIFAGFVLAGGTAGLGLMRLTPPAYNATTQVLVAAVGLQEQGNQVTNRQREPLNLDTEAQVAGSAVVAARAAGLLKAPALEPVEVAVPPNSAVLSLSVTAGTPAAAAAQSRAYAEAYLANRAATAQAALALQQKAMLAKLKQVNSSLAVVTRQLATLRKGTAEHTLASHRQSVLNRQAYTLTLKYDGLKTTTVTPGSVISEAVPPTDPAWPSLPLFLGTGLMLGLLLGAGAATARDRLDTRLRTPADVERLTGLPVVAALPPAGRTSPDGTRRAGTDSAGAEGRGSEDTARPGANWSTGLQSSRRAGPDRDTGSSRRTGTDRGMWTDGDGRTGPDQDTEISRRTGTGRSRGVGGGRRAGTDRGMWADGDGGAGTGPAFENSRRASAGHGAAGEGTHRRNADHGGADRRGADRGGAEGARGQRAGGGAGRHGEDGDGTELADALHELASAAVAACPGKRLLVRAVPAGLSTTTVTSSLSASTLLSVLDGSDTGDLARADAALLLVGLGRTTSAQVLDAARHLGRHQVPVIGVVTTPGEAASPAPAPADSRTALGKLVAGSRSDSASALTDGGPPTDPDATVLRRPEPPGSTPSGLRRPEPPGSTPSGLRRLGATDPSAASIRQRGTTDPSVGGIRQRGTTDRSVTPLRRPGTTGPDPSGRRGPGGAPDPGAASFRQPGATDPDMPHLGPTPLPRPWTTDPGTTPFGGPEAVDPVAAADWRANAPEHMTQHVTQHGIQHGTEQGIQPGVVADAGPPWERPRPPGLSS